jgi:Holliday junction resolvase
MIYRAFFYMPHPTTSPMSDFEREIVRCLNHFFKTYHIPGYAYRHGIRKSAGQYPHVLADSPDPSCCLAIECKSIIDTKLYFSQHFHCGRDTVHRIDVISDFLLRTGRTGFLAVEFRQGPATADEAFLIPWPEVAGRFRDTKGITIDDARSGIILARSKYGYRIESLNAK